MILFLSFTVPPIDSASVSRVWFNWPRLLQPRSPKSIPAIKPQRLYVQLLDVNDLVASWWFQPIWINKNGKLPQIGMKINNIWNQVPRLWWWCWCWCWCWCLCWDGRVGQDGWVLRICLQLSFSWAWMCVCIYYGWSTTPPPEIRAGNKGY